MHQKLELASPWEVARLRGLVEHSAVGGDCVAVQHLIDLQKGVFISTADNLFRDSHQVRQLLSPTRAWNHLRFQHFIENRNVRMNGTQLFSSL